MKESTKSILVIAAIIITLIVWIVLTCMILADIGAAVSSELSIVLLVAVLLLLILPIILIMPIYKSSNGLIIGVVWSVTLFLYSIIPLKAYIDKNKYRMRSESMQELITKIDAPTTSWEEFKPILDNAMDDTDETEHSIMSRLLNKRRFDLAQKMATERVDMRSFNMAIFLKLNDSDTTTKVDIIEFLLDNGADINDYFGGNYSTFRGDNSLNISLRNNDTLSAQLLIDRGINFTPQYESDAAIGLAACAGSRKMVQFFLNKKMNINHPGSYGATPILYIVSNGSNSEMVELFCQNGAYVNHIDNGGFDALYYVRSNEVQVKILVEAGASVTRTYPNGKTILDFVDQESHPDLWQYLYDAGARSAKL